jgi:hypothetical protein
MITQLYTLAPGSYVVADEWNANFRTIYNTNLAHYEAIQDAYNTLAFPSSDLSDVYAAVRSQPNCFEISGTDVTVAPECEYFKVLGSGEDLVINIPTGLNAEARVLIQIQDDRSLLPFSIGYSGTTIINHYNNYVFRAGYYYIMIYETNGVAQVKLIWTGV